MCICQFIFFKAQEHDSTSFANVWVDSKIEVRDCPYLIAYQKSGQLTDTVIKNEKGVKQNTMDFC